MGRFATREDKVDDLFRLGVFVDLYRAVRQGVRAGVENYSIKRLEPLCGYDPRVDLEEATASLIAFEAAFEDGTAAGDGERQRVVAGYNQDDCRATLALRGWLEERRAELAERLGQELPRRVFPDKPGAAEEPETARIRSALLDRFPAVTSGGDGQGAGAGAAGRPARLAPARGQTGLVAVLRRPHAEPGRTDRRAGRAGRAHRRRHGLSLVLHPLRRQSCSAHPTCPPTGRVFG